MDDIHSFENTVVAVLTSGDTANEALDLLAEAGYEVELLEGESGSDHLDPVGDGGFWASIKRAATALGDEKRVLDQLDSALAEGRVVISVDIEDREGKEAVSILREHGEYVWKFDNWTFTPIDV
ncbi:hypothetical protein BH23ACT4_BH23ACT4_09110 [soil metagenome]